MIGVCYNWVRDKKTPLNQPEDDRIKSPQMDMLSLMSNPRHRGKHLIVVADKLFTARTGEGAAKILQRVRKKYPDQTPAVTYIPDADALIVSIWEFVDSNEIPPLMGRHLFLETFETHFSKSHQVSFSED